MQSRVARLKAKEKLTADNNCGEVMLREDGEISTRIYLLIYY
jgi:hypothetical protein